MKLTNKQNKFLNELANKLPVTYEERGSYLEESLVPHLSGKYEALSFDIVPNFSPKIVSEGAQVVSKEKVALCIVNHKRRLRKSFIGGGYDGVRKYMKWVSKNNEYLNNKYEMTLAMDVTEEIIKLKIQPFL